jgi:hypothetical protein
LPLVPQPPENARPVEIGVVPRELAEQIRAEHGLVRANDIERAMIFLEGGRLARRSPTGWTVYWRELRQTGEDRDLADALARRFVRPPSRPAWQAREPEAPAGETAIQERLFE